MALRHSVGGQQALIVRDTHRFEGRAVGLILPDGPLGQAGAFRRGITQSIAFARKLKLQVHCRAPDEIRSTGTGSRLGGEAVIYFRSIEIVVFNLQERIERFEILQQRLDAGRVGRGVDNQLSFFLRRGDGGAALGRITPRKLSEKYTNQQRAK